MTPRWILAPVVSMCLVLSGCGLASGRADDTTGVGSTEPIPTAIEAQSIGAYSTLIPIGMTRENEIAVPPTETPEQAGYYINAPLPGAVGPAIILGHIDGDGRPGVFVNLARMKKGDLISVLRADGSTIRFRVTRVEQAKKNQFPTEAVYGNTTTQDIRLLSCGGIFDRTARSYEDNIIVYGTRSDA